MDLKQFVQETLIQIAEGIAGANRELQSGDTGAIINPETTFGSEVPKTAVQPVAFDVALTVTDASTSIDKSETGGRAGLLSVASVAASLNSEQTGSSRTEAISRVSFSVRMQQPANLKPAPNLQIPRTRNRYGEL